MSLNPNTIKVLDALNETARIIERGTHAGDFLTARHYSATPGKTRDRVVVQSVPVRPWDNPDFTNAQRSVQCFVEHGEDARILYSGSWESPAKWKSGLASEFLVSEAEDYAQFVAHGYWGYNGSRNAWESSAVNA